MPNSVVKSNSKVPDVLFIGAFFVIDQISKSLYMFSDRFVCNVFGPWGLEINGNMIVPATIVFLVILIFLLGRESDVLMRVPLSLFIAGGLANLSDRVFYGCVRDFALVQWFPAFNMADIVLTTGVILMSISLFKIKRPE